jgi:hypothetical protein
MIDYCSTMFEDVRQRVGGYTPRQRMARLHEIDAQLRRLEAEAAVLVDHIGHDRVFRDDSYLTINAYLRGDLRWSKQQITDRKRLARLVARNDGVERVLDHLHAGAIGVQQAYLFAEAAANPRCGDRLGEHVDLLLEHARVLSFKNFACAIGTWERLADQDGAHRDAAASHDARSAFLTFHDGVGRLHAQCGGFDFAQFAEIFEQYRHAEFLADWELAKAQYGEDAADAMLPRSDAQRSWDALMKIALDAVSTPPGAQAPEPVVSLVCGVNTMEAQLEQAGLIPAPEDSPEPELPELPLDMQRCETSTGIPVTPAEVMLAAIHGRVRRVVFDSAGVVVDYGRLRRLFEGAMREAVMLHSRTCIFPGCERPATWCQADHLTPWQQQGPTSTVNGGPTCAKHNQIRNRGFDVWRDPNGVYHIYRPDGHEVAIPPPRPTGNADQLLDAAA